MSRLPKARKDVILSKMLAPHPPSIRELAQREGISEATLYNWRNQLRKEGRPVPEHDRSSENWSAQTKFAVIVETLSMSEIELSEYGRAKGLFPEQDKQWREISIQAHAEPGRSSDAGRVEQNTAQRKQIKRLEREVLRKDKALAEAAALLILQKKVRALWGDNEDD